MNGIDWPLVGLCLGIAAVALLTGAGLGFFTASRDLDAERAKAWSRGRADAVKASRDADAAANLIALPNPYLATKTRPAKPSDGYVFTSTSIPIPVPPSPLFDQDEHPTELRGDD